jgi:DNA repair protein RadC
MHGKLFRSVNGATRFARGITDGKLGGFLVSRRLPAGAGLATLMAMPSSSSAAGHRARLRERFLKGGFESPADYEVLEILLTLCIPRRDVKPAAKALLKQFGSVRGVLDAPVGELQRVPGIGAVAPVALRIIRETAALYLRQSIEGRPVLDNGEKLADFWRLRLGPLRNEVFEVAYLDHHYQLIEDGVERLEEGTPAETVVYPRKVMESALRKQASHIVVAHNHPTGDVTPSDHDKRLTRALQQAGQPLGIKVIDHLIVAAEKTYSFRKSKLLAPD